MPHAAFFPSAFSSLSARLSVFLVLLAGLLLPVGMRAQVTYTGSAASQNFGSVGIGSSKTEYLSFSVEAGTTVGSIGVLTQGTPDLDFTNAAKTTCTATTYASATNCSVEVTFTPKAAGLRMGAVVFFSGASNIGNQLGSVFIHGSGEGPQIAFNSAVAIAIEPVVDGLALAGGPGGVVVDAAGDIFVTDSGNNRVVEIPAGGGAPTAIVPTLPGETFQSPQGIAVDGAGNLFFASYYTFVVEMPAGGGAPIIVVNGLMSSFNAGLAVDGLGDLYVTGAGQTVEVPPGGSPIYFSYGGATGVAVDSQGDVYYAEWCCGDWMKVAPNGAQTQYFPTVNGQTFGSPISVAVDAAGDLFVGDMHSGIGELPSSGQTASAIAPMVDGSGLGGPNDIVLDGAGNLYIANSGANPLVEVLRSQPASMSFAITNAGSTSTDSPQSMQISNNGNEPLTFSAIGYPADFSQNTGVANTCNPSKSLSAGAWCVLPIDFTPSTTGSPLSEEVTVTDNALNVTAPMQSIAVSGTAIPAGVAFSIALTAPAPVVAGAPVSLTVKALTTNGSVATSYAGTVSFASSDPLFVNPGNLTLQSGMGKKTVTLFTAGTQTITATDTSSSALTGTAGFLVTAGPAAGLQITNVPASTYASAQFQFTVTAVDAYGNAATPTVNFSSTDPLAYLPAAATLSGGTGVFNATLRTLGSQTITATVSGSSVSATSSVITVIAPSNLVVTTSRDDEGTASNCTVQAVVGTGTDAACSLRDALLEAANLASTIISFDATVFATPQTITLGSAGTLTIPSSTAIAGPGEGATAANAITVNGAGAYTVFTVNSGVTSAAVNGVSITNGAGAILNNGFLTVSNSTLSGNSTANGGAIDNNGTLAVINSTLYGNSTGSNGGGIFNTGTVTLTSSTIYGNVASNGGGIFSWGTLTLANTIVSGNGANGGPSCNQHGCTWPTPDLYGGWTDSGGNLVGVYGVNLAPLGNYGGPTETMVPFPGSSALCAGTKANETVARLTADQRGFQLDPDCPAGSVDSGAVQSNYALTFAVEPPASITEYRIFTPAPVVELLESGVSAALATDQVTLTDGTGQMTGTTTAALSSGSASFSNLAVPVAASDDLLTATMALTSLLNLTAQSIPVQVNAPGPDTLYLPPWGTVLAGPEATFVWTPSGGATGYSLWIGTTGVGSNNLYDSGELSVTSVKAAGLPTNGATIYVRLYTSFGKSVVHSDYVYTATTRAVLTSPAAGTELPGSIAAFTWSAATGATGYSLWLGSTGPGSKDLYDSGEQTVTTVEAGRLPINGETIYARLYTSYNAAVVYNDSTYIAATLAALTSPAPGSTLPGPVATFMWSAGSGPTPQYNLWFGSTGVGSNDLYRTGWLNTTSFTLPGLPTTGGTIYVRLFTNMVDATASKDYTFTAANLPQAAILSPAPGSTLPGSIVTFTWSSAPNGPGGVAPQYALTVYYGFYVIQRSGWISGNSVTLAPAYPSAIPINGEPLTVVLSVNYGSNGIYPSASYSYTAASPPVLTAPAPSSTLTGPTVTFDWSAVTGATGRSLYLGTTGAGSSNLFDSGEQTGASIRVAGLPTNGVTIYARLITISNDSPVYSDSTYTATTQAAMTTPAGGSVLGGANVTFTWSASSGATGYSLWLGSKGAGSNDLYESHETTGTSATAMGLPTNGETIYARLATFYGNVTVYNDYTYTAQ